MAPIWSVTVHAAEMAMDIFANCICLSLIGPLALARAMQKDRKGDQKTACMRTNGAGIV